MSLPLLIELKRRRVIRALIGYAVAAFAVLQLIEPIMHGLRWPDAVARTRIYAWRGEADRAFEWLGHAVEHHDPGLNYLKYDPIIRSLRGAPAKAESSAGLSRGEATASYSRTGQTAWRALGAGARGLGPFRRRGPGFRLALRDHLVAARPRGPRPGWRGGASSGGGQETCHRSDGVLASGRLSIGRDLL